MSNVPALGPQMGRDLACRKDSQIGFIASLLIQQHREKWHGKKKNLQRGWGKERKVKILTLQPCFSVKAPQRIERISQDFCDVSDVFQIPILAEISYDQWGRICSQVAQIIKGRERGRKKRKGKEEGRGGREKKRKRKERRGGKGERNMKRFSQQSVCKHWYLSSISRTHIKEK